MEQIARAFAFERREGQIGKLGEDYVADYFTKVAGYPVARRVRLVDLADNSNPCRLTGLDAEARARLERKYETARRALEPVAGTEGGLK